MYTGPAGVAAVVLIVSKVAIAGSQSRPAASLEYRTKTTKFQLRYYSSLRAAQLHTSYASSILHT